MDLPGLIGFYSAAMLGTALLLGAGALVAAIVHAADTDEHAPLRAAAVAVAYGWGLVPSYAFFGHLITGVHVSRWGVATAALAHGALLLSPSLRARARRGLGVLKGLGRRRNLVVVGAVLTVRLFYAVGYDPSPPPPEGSCIYSAALTATGHKDAELRLLVENVEDARLGNTAVISGFIALYEGLGFRELHATCGTLLALGGFLLGLGVGGSRRWGWVGLGLLALNPWVIGLPQTDQNLLTLAWLTPLCALTLKRPSWLLVGLWFGLVITMRHVLVLALPAFFFLAWTDGARGRALALLLLGLALETAMENLHHLLALGSLLRFESNAQFPALPYDVFGARIHWEGLMNWPLHDQLVRTPHRPFPTWLAWPLHVADHLGLVLSSALVVGTLAVWRRVREAMFWALLFGPVFVLLGLQEAWDVPNKMGVLLVAFTPLAAWALHGLREATLRPRTVGPVLIVLCLCGLLGARSLEAWRAPVDERYHAVHPEAPRENAGQVDDEARREASVGLLPDVTRPSRQGARGAASRARAFGADVLDPRLDLSLHPWGWFEDEPPEPGPPVTVAIDLAAAPWGRADFVTLTDAPAHLDLSQGPGIATGIEVGWDARDLAAYGLAGQGVTTLALVFERPVDADQGHCRCRWDGEFLAPCDGRCSLLYDVAGLHSRGPGANLEWGADRPVEGSVLRVRVPSGGLSVGVFLVPFADRFVLWKVWLGADGVRVAGPWMPWHS